MVQKILIVLLFEFWSLYCDIEEGSLELLFLTLDGRWPKDKELLGMIIYFRL